MAVGLAAVLHDKNGVADRTVAVIATGGDVDTATYYAAHDPRLRRRHDIDALIPTSSDPQGDRRVGDPGIGRPYLRCDSDRAAPQAM